MVADEVRRIFIYLEESIRYELDELHRFAAVHPADIQAVDFLRIFNCHSFLDLLCRQYYIAEDKLMRSLGTVDNVSLPNTLDHAQVEKLIQDISSAIVGLQFCYDCDETRSYAEVASELQGLCGSVRVALLGRNFLHTDCHFTPEAEEKLLGRILGSTCAEVIQLMLGWVTSSLSQDEQKKVMDAWKHVTRNTYFQTWLSKRQKETPKENCSGDCYSDWLAGFRDYKLSSSEEEESSSEESTSDLFESVFGHLMASHFGRGRHFCPFCNKRRTGKGLGIDCFHCMTCSGCLSMNLGEHVCWERCFEGTCTICLEDFDSKRTGKLPCGHLTHLDCFEDYTGTYSVCPICKKSPHWDIQLLADTSIMGSEFLVKWAHK